MTRPVVVQFINDAANELERLNQVVGEEVKKGTTNSENHQLLKSIQQKIELLKANPTYGAAVPKRLIPKDLPIDNLWVVDLTGYWRMLYTLKGEAVQILCIVLQIVDHKKYDKFFGYKKK